jgi:hypothetical protein
MAKLTGEWSSSNGQSYVTLQKSKGKLTLDEIEHFLRYNGFCGQYVIHINATEESCEGSGWGDEIEDPGDSVRLIYLEQGMECPVCSRLLDVDGTKEGSKL